MYELMIRVFANVRHDCGHTAEGQLLYSSFLSLD